MRRALLPVIAALVASMVPVGNAAAQTATQIRFLNPSEYGDAPRTLSDVPDVDGAYHLVAWVSGIPANPVVEFELVPDEPGALPVRTATATRVGSSDTWEHFLDLTTIDDGEYLLRARVYRGPCPPSPDPSCQQVATHEVPVTVDKDDDEVFQAAETVEITSPTNVGAAGFFRGKATTPGARLTGKASADTSNVFAFYTTSPPGTEPAWVECGEDEPDASDNVSIRCALASGTPQAQVTAVAMLAEGSVTELGVVPAQGSGDAHRIFPYTQVPTDVDIQPNSVQVPPPFPACSPVFTVTVRDQNGAPVASADVDVHAAGPNDELRFASVGPTNARQTSPFQPPNSNHLNPPENAWDCNSNEAGGMQGQHEDPGTADRKHIESTTGTNVNGTFRFALRSETAGQTTVQAWADADDDDIGDLNEPSAGAQVGWGEAPVAPAVTVTIEPASRRAETHTCQLFNLVVRQGGEQLSNRNVDVHLSGPDGSVAFCDTTATSSRRNPDAGHTDPAGTRHSEGETNNTGRFIFGVTSNATGTTSIRGWLDETDDDVRQEETEPGDTASVQWTPSGRRDITIHRSRRRVPRGGHVRIFGRIIDGPACSNHESVILRKRRKDGRGPGTLIRSGRTNNEGKYAFYRVRRIRHAVEFRTIAPRTAQCDRAASRWIPVRVRRR